MEPIFDSRPMPTDRIDPLFRREGVILAIADVISDILKGCPLSETEVMDLQGTSGMRKIDFQGLNRRYADPQGFKAAMSFLADVKKGETAVRRAKRALMVGWLPLTWRR